MSNMWKKGNRLLIKSDIYISVVLLMAAQPKQRETKNTFKAILLFFVAAREWKRRKAAKKYISRFSFLISKIRRKHSGKIKGNKHRLS